MVDLRKNQVKQKLNSGESAVVLMGLDSSDAIEKCGPGNHDGVWLEGEHGGVDFSELGELTRACDIWGKTSITRVHQNQAGLIYRTLDRGSQGICVPHVNTEKEARDVIKAGKFPPIGERGMYPGRQSYGVEDYYVKANDETLLIVLVEDIIAINNLSQILSVDHIDVFCVAPSDLAASMGHIGVADHPNVQSTIDDALTQIVRSGKTAGTLVTEANIQHFHDLGVRFFITHIQSWITDGITRITAKVR
ncbi:MAG: hypothetical protein CMM32_04410 [Rhodospirillaceae bacterium]|nr:hypothetical protein [Rhodospirillaceae bacterium]|tara:strand:- start:802 stop:1548 length:747 start_codon:yes stop_codon:yes gene_type:complete